jgi:foldase protein PrsA
LIALSAALLLAPVAQAQTPPLAPGELARVEDKPILKAEFDHWLVVAALSAGQVEPDPENEQLRLQVMQLLISFRWLEGEAARLGIAVSPAAVNREYRRQKRQSFPKDAAFRRFLRTSGQTVADVKQRVRLDMLSERVRDRAVRRAKTPRGEQRLLDRYVVRLTARWRARTICLEGYDSDNECGTVVPASA